MIKKPKCPNCGSSTAPKLVEVKTVDELFRSTYEEYYNCSCGCQLVVLVPRAIDEDTPVYKIVKEGNSERWI